MQNNYMQNHVRTNFLVTFTCRFEFTRMLFIFQIFCFVIQVQYLTLIELISNTHHQLRRRRTIDQMIPRLANKVEALSNLAKQINI